MTRELVLEALLEIMEKGAYSNVVIHETLKKYQYLDKQNRAFFTRLCEGTIERCMELDYIIDGISSVKVTKMKPVIRTLLRMGAYQILYMDQVPDSAACNEAVKLANKKGFSRLKGFVNGVLRNISRQKGTFVWPEDKKEEIKIRYSMPEWILDLWLEEYDLDTVEKICAGFFEEKHTTIRNNTKKISVSELQERLLLEGVSVEQGAYLPYALYLQNYNYLSGLKAFSEGLFFVQDESSMLIAQCAGIKPGDNIIDICAAPGGKSTHAAELLLDSGWVSARDVSENKIALMEENIERLSLTNISALLQDARVPDVASIGTADIVFADLPCSGLGVMKKKGDIKYKTKSEDIQALQILQREILDVCVSYVKPGGTLLYSTCTINHFENLDNVSYLLEQHDFILDDICPYLPAELRRDSAKEGYLQLLPGVDRCDGFFLARLKRKG